MPSRAIDPLFFAFQQAVAGRYSLERELGRGGMGVVYLAREVRLDRPVAIKLLPPELSAQPNLRERFLREARTAGRLSHPYIVPIHAVDEVDEFVFYVMAFVDGETLGERVRARGPLPAADVSRILREVAWALAYAHAQDVVHRDVKPANILLESGTNRAMVTDFGIARVASVAGETMAGELLGTPEYMSPEQCAGEAVDGRSDLYSLGLVGYFAASGTLPFTGGPRELLAQHITKPAPSLALAASAAPESLVAAIDRCLMKESAHRFGTGEELADALAANLQRKEELPVPLRVFLDRRRMSAVVAPPLFGLMMLMPMIDTMTRGGVPITARVGFAAAVGGLMMVGPVIVLTRRLRQLMRHGFGPGDVAGALRTMVERRQEEFLYEFGPKRSRRETVLRVVGWSGVAGLTASLGAITLIPDAPDAVIGATLLSSYAAAIGMIVTIRWQRLRKGKEPLLAKFWDGAPGRFLGRIAGVRLGQRAMPADRPTELGIAMNAEAIFDELPKQVRKSVGDVPGVLRSLETHARAMRARITQLDASIMDARRASGRADAGAVQSELLRDLEAARAQAEQRLAEVVTALETLRLNLLRLRAGAGGIESVTHDLAAALALGDDVERLLAGQREVERVLRARHKEPATPV